MVPVLGEPRTGKCVTYCNDVTIALHVTSSPQLFIHSHFVAKFLALNYAQSVIARGQPFKGGSWRLFLKDQVWDGRKT